MKDVKYMNSILSKRMEKFLLIANILMIILIISDLFYLTGIFKTDLPLFTLVNLIVMCIGLFSFRVKRDAKNNMEKKEPEN